MADRHPTSVIRTTTRIAFGLGVLALAVGMLVHQVEFGALACLGLFLGAGNMAATNRFFGDGSNGNAFYATSALRLVGLTVSAFIVFAIFHQHGAIAFVLGVAVAQFALSASATYATVVK